MTANELDSQNNCLMCSAFSRTTAFYLSRQSSIDLSMKSECDTYWGLLY